MLFIYFEIPLLNTDSSNTFINWVTRHIQQPTACLTSCLLQTQKLRESIRQHQTHKCRAAHATTDHNYMYLQMAPHDKRPRKVFI